MLCVAGGVSVALQTFAQHPIGSSNTTGECSGCNHLECVFSSWLLAGGVRAALGGGGMWATFYVEGSYLDKFQAHHW